MFLYKFDNLLYNAKSLVIHEWKYYKSKTNKLITLYRHYKEIKTQRRPHSTRKYGNNWVIVHVHNIIYYTSDDSGCHIKCTADDEAFVKS